MPKKVRTWLEPDGKIFAVNETPYFGTLKDFIPTYERNIHENKPYPGYISLEDAPNFFELSKRPFVKSSVHLFDKELCFYICQKSGFEITDYGYLDRKGYFPEDALFNGKESIWFIANKKN